MREIKFRAWSHIKNKMFSPEEMISDQLTLLPDGRFINVHGGNTQLSRIFEHSEMLPMQFTGLKDCNGKDLYYDSDIVLLIPLGIKAYASKDDFDCPHWICGIDLFIDWIEYFNKYDKNSFEIIGTKQQNPESIP